MSVSQATVSNPLSLPRVLVLGTLNIDHVWSVTRLPKPGQTLLAKNTRRGFGGKGANQAVAAARHGARVHMVGAVGRDEDGDRYREHLNNERIDSLAVVVDFHSTTGAAHVYVDDLGENMIVVDAGANRLLDADLTVSLLGARLKATDVLLMQLECPLDAVAEALRMAHTQGVRTVLNASPYNPDFTWITPVDTVIVNEHECVEFFGQDVRLLSEMTDAQRGTFLKRYEMGSLIVTQGGEPTLYLSRESAYFVPVYRVEPEDTVGAGDTFAGTLAVCLAEDVPWKEAVRRANIAAALSTLSMGAQVSMPTREQVMAVACT